MILALTDGHETVYLAVILQAASENKEMSDILPSFVTKDRVPELLEQIRTFARGKLNHPVLKIAFEEADELLSSYEERKTHYQRQVRDDSSK